jgi:hypothetical protein
MRTVAMLANEAADAVMRGVASPAAIHLAMEKGVNYPRGHWRGPMRWVRLHTRRWRTSPHYGEDRYRISPLLSRRAAWAKLHGEHAPRWRRRQAQALAGRVAAAMWERDDASQALGMRIVRVAPDTPSWRWPSVPTCGHAICHGGFIFVVRSALRTPATAATSTVASAAASIFSPGARG